MENKLELGLISTASTNSVGFLDTYGDEPVNIKMSISDIKDISKRSAPYTQSFTIQGSEKNNRLLTQIFNIGSDSTFNESKKIDYQVTIFSESQDLFKNIGDAYIEDLDFSDLNHVWDYSGITLSWTGSNQSYFYPLIDYGYDLNITDMNIGMGVKAEEMFPALQVKTIVDRIFSAAGYSYDSTFLSGTYFTNLYIPFNGTTELNQDNSFATGRSFDVGISTDYTLTKTLTAGILQDFTDQITIPLNKETPAPYFDNGNLYDTTIYKYSADTSSVQQFSITLDEEFTRSNTNVAPVISNVIIKFYRSTYSGGFEGSFYSQS